MQMYQREEQDPEVERIRAQARQAAQNDPELQRERQELANARAAAQKEFDDLQWQKFFNRNRHVKDCFSNRQPLENYARTLPGGLTAQNLQEALQHPDIAKQLDVDKHYVSPTTANLAVDKATLENFCRTNRLQYPGESALRILRDTYGGNLGGWAIQDAIDRRLITVNAENDPQILAQWDHEDKVQRAYHLKEFASPSELRQQARAEFAATAQAKAQAEFQETQKISAQLQSGYPPLPETWNGKLLDAQFIKKADKDTLRAMIRKHGSASVTARLQGQ